ncbi:MAG: hypothetical protein R3192_00430 [Woeseiaceae bacterium]|nr:hypothetical protein [Woeseiaceae bacterium]
MSADTTQADRAIRLAVLCGLMGCAGLVTADDESLPDIEFLEYLGSWEESDADWVMFSKIDAEQTPSEAKRSDPVSKDEESVEIDDER